MRNIRFDESTVLNEYARMAHEKGLIKKAEGQGVHNFPEDVVEGDPSQSVHNFPEDVVKGDPSQSVHNFPEDVIKGKPTGTKPTGLGAAPKSLQEALALPPGPMRDAWVKKFMTVQKSPSLQQPVNKASSTKVDMSKEADSVYDVTGETGEQLIDSAHPGGGTKTELTHSKTDENLVETIVEQQEKDVEVAKSVPKGIYATLMDLRGKLEKMGLNDQIGKLDAVIEKVATPGDIVNYQLVSLADKLDEAGYLEASGKVDDLLKKVAVDVGEWAGIGGLFGGPLGAGAAALAGMIAKEFTVAQNVIGQLITNLKKLDPRSEDDQYKLENWIARLSNLQSYMRPFAPTGEPEKDRAIATSKLAQLREVAKYLKVVETQFGQTQFTDWFRDKGQAQQALSNAVSTINNRIQALETQYAQKQQEEAQQEAAKPEEAVEEQTGAAGKGKTTKRGDPKVKAKQEAFNEVWEELSKKMDNIETFFGRKLRPDGILGRKTRFALSKLPEMKKILAGGPAAAGKGETKPTEEKAEYIPMGEIRNAIVDKILKATGLRPHEVNLDTLYRMALQTARKNYKRKALTKDNGGYRRLETWVSDIVNHPNFDKTIAKVKK